MKKAVIYARYSSDTQTEQSIEGQLRVCQNYAKNNNLLIVDTYIDRAMTGTNDMRPDFQRMIKASSKRQWEYVIVFKLLQCSNAREPIFKMFWVFSMLSKTLHSEKALLQINFVLSSIVKEVISFEITLTNTK